MQGHGKERPHLRRGAGVREKGQRKGREGRQTDEFGRANAAQPLLGCSDRAQICHRMRSMPPSRTYGCQQRGTKVAPHWSWLGPAAVCSSSRSGGCCGSVNANTTQSRAASLFYLCYSAVLLTAASWSKLGQMRAAPEPLLIYQHHWRMGGAKAQPWLSCLRGNSIHLAHCSSCLGCVMCMLYMDAPAPESCCDDAARFTVSSGTL